MVVESIDLDKDKEKNKEKNKEKKQTIFGGNRYIEKKKQRHYKLIKLTNPCLNNKTKLNINQSYYFKYSFNLFIFQLS